MNNKYNNKYSRSSTVSPSMRFNKRPGYGANNSPRFAQQNQSPYNYLQNRHNISSPSGSSYKNNQYEQNTRNYYGHGSPKTPKHKQQQQQQNIKSSPYTHSPITNSPSSSSSTAITTNATKLPAQPPTTPQSATMTQQQPHSTQNVPVMNTDYSFAYNNYFYPNYNKDSTTSATTSSYGLNDTISPFMWQTITSTPPPNMLHQPPLPPLPQQLPHTQKPPLPGCDMLPPLHQPPPLPSMVMTTPPITLADQRENGNELGRVPRPLVKMKTKRKAMSARYNLSKTWTQEDAELALKAEEDNTNRQQNDIILILRFPDPELNREIIRSYSPAIESVHFQLNFAPRYCFVHLKQGTDVEKTIEDLSKISFGSGFISAEIKQMPSKVHSTKPCEIDPCTLYVGNLPTTIACKVLKEHFPGAARIDIGFAQRMKYTRYAFIRYQKVEHAIDAYKRMLDAEIGGRSVILRFRRIAASKEDQKNDAENPDDLQEDEFIFSETTINSGATQENSIEMTQHKKDSQNQIGENVEDETVAQCNLNKSITRKNSNNLNTNTATETQLYSDQPEEYQSISRVLTDSSKKADDTCKNDNNESNRTEANDSNTGAEKNRLLSTSSDITQVSSNSSFHTIHTIKTDPDDDPNDKVDEHVTLASRFDYYNNIKQEMALDSEFFAQDFNNQSNKTTGMANVNETTYLASTTDDTDETIDSGPSLSEFLRTCPTREESIVIENNLGAPPTKKPKLLDKNIKKETITCNLIGQNLSADNDDLVPTELSLLGRRNGVENSDINQTNYDEFYNEIPSKKSTTIHAKIKNEPLEDVTRIKTKQSPSNFNKEHKNSSKIDNRNNPLQQSISADEVLRNEFVVRNDFMLTEVKQEQINNEFYGMPSKKTNQEKSINTNEDKDLDYLWNTDFAKLSGTNLNLTVNNMLNAVEDTDKDTTNDKVPTKGARKQISNQEQSDDDDVVIISANFPSTSNKPNTSSSASSKRELIFLSQPNLVDFSLKPSTTDNRVKSWYAKIHDSSRQLQPRDYLDKLLNASDSDSDYEL